MTSLADQIIETVTHLNSDRCGFAMVDGDGEQEPCDRPVFGWRWYQDCDHEDAIDRACLLHANKGGKIMADLVGEVCLLRSLRDGAE